MNRSSAPCRPWPALLVSLAWLSSAGVARGEDDTAAARLFQEGRALMIEGRFAEACPRLEESQRLEPRGGTQLNLAVCHERQGKIATAWAELHDAMVTARTDGHPERERYAADRLAVLEPRLCWLTVSLAPGDRARDLVVQFDEVPLAPIALGKDLPVDPGEHHLRAIADGRVVWEKTVALEEAARAALTVTVEPPRPPTPEPPTPAPAEKRGSTHRAGRWVLDVGLVAGGYWDHVSAMASSRSPARMMLAAPSDRGFLLGLSGFAGYAAKDDQHVGARVFGGTLLSQSGGYVAAGPSMLQRLGGPVWGGGSLLVGVAVTGAPTTKGAYIPAWVGLSPGFSLELDVALVDGAAGSLMLQASPLGLASPLGFMVAVPVGLAYRWY